MFLYKQLEIYHRAGSKSRKVLQDSQSFYCKHNEILYVGYNSGGRKTASVQELIYHKLIRIYRVEKNRTYLLLRSHRIGRCHISCGDSMKHSSQADYCCSLFHHLPHGRLSLIGVSNDFRQGAVVPDRASQYKGDFIFYTTVHNAVINLIVFNELRNGATSSHPVDHIQMIIMAVGVGFLGVNILSQGGVEHR